MRDETQRKDRLTENLIQECLAAEPHWADNRSVSFSYGEWDVVLSKVPYQAGEKLFYINGVHADSLKSWSKGFPNIEQAFLHIFNQFPESNGAGNLYASLHEALQSQRVKEKLFSLHNDEIA